MATDSTARARFGILEKTMEKAMIRRQHIVPNFFDEADALREALDARFKDAYAHRINWHYFCDPRLYTYLRTSPQTVFEGGAYGRFKARLRTWCVDNLGLVPLGAPCLHLMVNGCRLGLHSDFHNGTWGYVYSLTRWDGRRFSGGETLVLRDGILSYKKHHVHGEVLYELIPAKFNQLLIFDDRIVHGTPTIEGSMDPMDGRIAMVGHIRATSPLVTGSVQCAEARRLLFEAMAHIRDRVKNFKDVQGTITFRLEVGESGRVESMTLLTNNLVIASAGYDRSDAVESVRSLIQDTVSRLTFPPASGRSVVVLPVLIPIPDLRPIEFAVAHESSIGAICEWAKTHLDNIDELEFLGRWEGQTYVVNEPVAGSINIERSRIVFYFDPPMWMPSQRERFQVAMTEWAKAASSSAKS